MKYEKKLFYLSFIILLGFIFFCPDVCYGTVEDTLSNMQGKLIGTILPLASILGFVFAGFSFVAGSPNARNHLILAIIGSVIGFGAPSIMKFIQSMVK